jgi:hypothetical protein
MRQAVKVTDVYTYDELSDAAKDRVRMTLGTDFWDADTVSENLKEALDAILGEGHSLKITEWGDSASRTHMRFEGRFYPSKAPAETDWKDAPVVPEVLRDFCRDHEGVMKYDRHGVMQGLSALDADDPGDRAEAERLADEFTDSLRHFLQGLVDAEVEYLYSDEYAQEASEANGFEYTIDGQRYW